MLFDLESNELEMSSEEVDENGAPLYSFTLDSEGRVIKLNGQSTRPVTIEIPQQE
jgi:hypothetical protein